jgi:hypothetical protein
MHACPSTTRAGRGRLAPLRMTGHARPSTTRAGHGPARSAQDDKGHARPSTTRAGHGRLAPLRMTNAHASFDYASRARPGSLRSG